MSSTLAVVDFENVQDVGDLVLLKDVDVKILVGKSQNKIPIDTVQTLQKLGNALEWVKVPGQGKNALDFFVAFYLGKYIEEGKYGHYRVISKDTGYDPLIEYLRINGTDVQRLVNAGQATVVEYNDQDNSDVEMLVAKIRKMNPKSRPKKRESLITHLVTALNNQKSKTEITRIVEKLFERKLLSEQNGRLKYSGIENAKT